MTAGAQSRRAAEASSSPLPVAFDLATALALALADLARRTDDAHLATLATDAHAVVTHIHAVAELLATLAGVPEPES